MARVHGRNGRMYVAIASGGSASLVAYMKNWSINFTVDRADVTAQGDANKVYVSGLPDAQGAFAGFYDDATAQLYTSAVDGVARSFYLYPSNSSASTYFFGTGLFDFSVTSDVGDSTQVSGSWAAASAVTKIG
jgi:hypothetical protein